MADISVTAANVAGGERVLNVTWGDTVTAGHAVYRDVADGKWKLAISSSASTAGANGVGIALNSGADGQPGRILITGAEFTPGATLTPGERYYVSGNAGGIKPSTDLASTEYVTLLFIAKSSSVAKMSPVVSGAQVP